LYLARTYYLKEKEKHNVQGHPYLYQLNLAFVRKLLRLLSSFLRKERDISFWSRINIQILFLFKALRTFMQKCTLTLSILSLQLLRLCTLRSCRSLHSSFFHPVMKVYFGAAIPLNNRFLAGTQDDICRVSFLVSLTSLPVRLCPLCLLLTFGEEQYHCQLSNSLLSDSLLQILYQLCFYQVQT